MTKTDFMYHCLSGYLRHVSIFAAGWFSIATAADYRGECSLIYCYYFWLFFGSLHQHSPKLKLTLLLLLLQQLVLYFHLMVLNSFILRFIFASWSCPSYHISMASAPPPGLSMWVVIFERTLKAGVGVRVQPDTKGTRSGAVAENNAYFSVDSVRS